MQPSGQTFLFLGAGSAGTGIADLLVQAMTAEGLLHRWGARSYLVLRRERTAGNVAQGFGEFPKAIRAQFTRPPKTFVKAIEAIQPNAFIGVSTIAKAFYQRMIEAMSRVNQRPIIFPYSNPTSHSECTAERGLPLVGGPRHLRERQPVSSGALQR